MSQGINTRYRECNTKISEGIDLDKRQLEAAPSYDASDAPNWSTGTYSNVVDKYYDGLPTIR